MGRSWGTVIEPGPGDVQHGQGRPDLHHRLRIGQVQPGEQLDALQSLGHGVRVQVQRGSGAGAILPVPKVAAQRVEQLGSALLVVPVLAIVGIRVADPRRERADSGADGSRTFDVASAAPPAETDAAVVTP